MTNATDALMSFVLLVQKLGSPKGLALSKEVPSALAKERVQSWNRGRASIVTSSSEGGPKSAATG